MPQKLAKKQPLPQRRRTALKRRSDQGHNLHPIDIERALPEDFSAGRKWKLQIEAKAHIATPRWIDEGGFACRATTAVAVCQIHHRFEAALPPDLLWVKNPKTGGRDAIVPSTKTHKSLRRRRCPRLINGTFGSGQWLGGVAVTRQMTHFSTMVGTSKLRTSHIQVGRQIAISSSTVPRFLARWERSHSGSSKFETVLQAAAAHHRLPIR
jgi:hypothetical protein